MCQTLHCLDVSQPQTHTSISSVIHGNSSQELSLQQDYSLQNFTLKLLSTQHPNLIGYYVLLHKHEGAVP